MIGLIELLEVALRGLLARPIRAALVALGPTIGVAALVGVLGLTASAKGDVNRTLNRLGTNLLVLQGPSPDAKLPIEAAERLQRVSTVREVAQSTVLKSVSLAASSATAEELSLAAAFQVRSADPGLAAVAGLEVQSGRFFTRSDESLRLPVAVIGSEAARFFAVSALGPRTILLNGVPFAVVGVLAHSQLEPLLDSTVIIPYSTARDLVGDEGAPTYVYARVAPGTTEATAAVLPAAALLGGPGTALVSVPTDLLLASAKVDAAFRAVVLGLGSLSLFVGAVGIANVMTISVLQRRTEIGIRRALGHTRGHIGAQFLLEAAALGILGGVAGMGAGVLFVVAGASQQGWVLILQPAPILGAGLLAVLVAIAAGIYPAVRASRLEPLETLRSG